MLIHQATPTRKTVIGQYLDAGEARQEALRMAEKTGGRYYTVAVTGVCEWAGHVRWLGRDGEGKDSNQSRDGGQLMATYRKKPIEVEATQWWRNGDHPADGDSQFEGQVVRYYRSPIDDGQWRCMLCGDIMHNHGWIDTPVGGYIVCPGDWVIMEADGECFPCKPEVFEKTYEHVARSGEAG